MLSDQAIYAIIAMSISLAIGSSISRSIEPSNRTVLNLLANFYYTKINVFLCISVISGILISYAYYRGFPPLLNYHYWNYDIFGYSSEIRRIMTKSYVFGDSTYAGQGIFKTFNIILWTYIGLLSFILLFDRYYSNIRLTLFYYICLILSCVNLFGTFIKRDLILFLIGIFIYTGLRKSSLYLVKSVMIALLVLFSIFYLEGRRSHLYGRKGIIPTISKQIFERISMSNGRNDIYLIDLYPEKKGFGGGKEHFRRLLNALPGKPVPPLGYELNLWLFKDKNENRSYWTSTYLGIVYADFRIVGILLIFSFIGFMGPYLFRLGYYFVANQSIPHISALFLSVWIYYIHMGYSGFSGTLIKLLVLLSLFIFLHWMTDIVTRFAKKSAFLPIKY